MTQILPNSIQLDKSQNLRSGLGASQGLDKSIALKQPNLINNPSVLTQEPSILLLNQMVSDINVGPGTSQSLAGKDGNLVAMLQNSKTPAPVINEKLQRCSDFKQKSANIPPCFKENTPKEELVLEHVIQYKRQFQLVYESEARELFLYPKNECDVYKVL